MRTRIRACRPISRASTSRQRTGAAATPPKRNAARVHRPSAPDLSTPPQTMAKSPLRCEISVKAAPARAGSGMRISVSNSPCCDRGLEHAEEEICCRNDPLAALPRMTSAASSASITAGNSAAGSACARLPPMVPRARVGGWPTSRQRLSNKGHAPATSGEASSSRLPRHGADAQLAAHPREFRREASMRLRSTSTAGRASRNASIGTGSARRPAGAHLRHAARARDGLVDGLGRRNSRRRGLHAALPGDRVEHALGRDRQIVLMPGVEAKRVRDRVADGGRDAGRADLADALDAERIGGRARPPRAPWRDRRRVMHRRAAR